LLSSVGIALHFSCHVWRLQKWCLSEQAYGDMLVWVPMLLVLLMLRNMAFLGAGLLHKRRAAGVAGGDTQCKAASQTAGVCV
jgi:hypothetical protein